MAFPFEHGLHSTLIAMRIADRLGVDREHLAETYYACLLSHSGCTTDAHVTPQVFGGSLTTHLHPLVYGSGREVLTGLLRALPDPDTAGLARARQVARRLPRLVREQRTHLAAACEVAGMLADGLGLSPAVQGQLAHLLERWDGHGPLGGAKGEEIPLPMRIVHLAVDAAFQRMLGGDERVVRLVRERAGHAFDPELADCLIGDAERILALDAHASVWEETLACEPDPPMMLAGEALDRALAAMGNFADLISPYLTGHSVWSGGAGRGSRAALPARRRRRRRAPPRGARPRPRTSRGASADLGKAGTADRGRAGAGAAAPLPLRAGSRALGVPGARSRRLAGAHHERLDGSGYHRGGAGRGPAASRAAARGRRRVPRDDRAARAPRTDRARTGGRDPRRDTRAPDRLDADAVTAVVEAAGQTAPRIERPAGLTGREVEVVRLLARGLQTKQVAGALGISTKTADRHIQNAYRKIGVSSRAAATLFAMEHGLMAWGELPMARPPARP